MIMVLEGMAHERRLRDLGLFSLQKRKWREILWLSTSTWMEDIEKSLFDGAQWKEKRQWT